MPKGRNKGFQYYMCKKFFHPSNPANLERVYIAKERLKEKEKKEGEKQVEYEREQERWRSRHMLSKEEDKNKLELSFMYEPPVGVKKEEKETETGSTSRKENKEEFKFDWQRKAPRESYAKDDPNITDHPFGIQVQFTKCMKCQVWGHSHTDKICPNYGKAKDHEEPVTSIDQRKLVRGLEDEGMRFTSYGTWDNGKNGKQYDFVFSSEEEPDDLLSNLVSKLRKKKKRSRRCNSNSDSESGDLQSKSRKFSKSENHRQTVLSQVDTILTSETPKIGAKTLGKIDKILFSDIGTCDPVDKKHFLSRVDKILDIGDAEASEATDSSSDSSESDNEKAEEPSDDESEDLTESEMRLLNLININKIDVKVNFPNCYPDTACHFCREEETSTHIAACPVYDKVMRGTEFSEIKSEDVQVVKKALGNILKALLQRSQALAVTSVGNISRKNMRLLNIYQEENNKNEERDKRVEQILQMS